MGHFFFTYKTAYDTVTKTFKFDLTLVPGGLLKKQRGTLQQN